MKKTQKKNKKAKEQAFGFGNRLVVVAVLIVGLVGLVGYKATQRNYVSTTDSSGSFSYEYPEDWAIQPYVWEDCCHGPPKSEPDWSKQSKPITLYPASDKDVTVTVTAEKYGDYWDSFKAVKDSVKEDYFATVLFEGKRGDGHEALFSRVDYLGPPDAKVESFIDHRYYFDNGDYMLRVEFREKYHHDWPDDETGPDIDNTKYLADFEHIAKSIKFSN